MLGAVNFYKHYNLWYSSAIKLLQTAYENQYSSGQFALYANNGNVFTTVPMERMRITSLGNVGLGTINPDETLL